MANLIAVDSLNEHISKNFSAIKYHTFQSNVVYHVKLLSRTRPQDNKLKITFKILNQQNCSIFASLYTVNELPVYLACTISGGN